MNTKTCQTHFFWSGKRNIEDVMKQYLPGTMTKVKKMNKKDIQKDMEGAKKKDLKIMPKILLYLNIKAYFSKI